MPIKELICKFCNSIFSGMTSKNRSPIYCNRICMKAAYTHTKLTSSCITCSKEMIFSPWEKKKYCSQHCIRYSGDKECLRQAKSKGVWQTSTDEEKLILIQKAYEERVIKKEGCWGWNRVTFSKGYGKINTGKRKILLAHRASWLIHNGKIPDGLWVLHKCDNPVCSNPDHLFLGTAKDNSIDCAKKNRKNISYGTDRKHTKLNEEKVAKIKLYLEEKLSFSKIASLFNVSVGCIQQIKEGRTWKLNRGIQ